MIDKCRVQCWAAYMAALLLAVASLGSQQYTPQSERLLGKWTATMRGMHAPITVTITFSPGNKFEQDTTSRPEINAAPVTSTESGDYTTGIDKVYKFTVRDYSPQCRQNPSGPCTPMLRPSDFSAKIEVPAPNIMEWQDIATGGKVEYRRVQ